MPPFTVFCYAWDAVRIFIPSNAHQSQAKNGISASDERSGLIWARSLYWTIARLPRQALTGNGVELKPNGECAGISGPVEIFSTSQGPQVHPGITQRAGDCGGDLGC